MVEPIDEVVSAFFVGPGKCGTSWVFNACRAHPGLNVGLIKEPGVFLRPDADIAKYQSLWRGAGIRCDFSNTYFFSEIAAESIRRYNPEARIGITVREPVARLVSQYAFMRRNGRYSGSISAAILEHPEIVDRCRYARHLSKWLDRFEPGQILILRLETLKAQPARYRQALFAFLGVPDRGDPLPAARQRLAAASPRSRLLARGTKELAELARKARLYRMIEWVKNSAVIDLLYRPLPANYQDSHLLDIPSIVREELEEDFRQFESTISRLDGMQVV